MPTTAHGKVVPTATIEGVRPRELGRNGMSYELGGQARVIRMPMGIGRMIKIGGSGQLGLNHQPSTIEGPAQGGSFFLPAKTAFRQKGISV